MVLEERDLIMHKALAEEERKAIAKLFSRLEKKCFSMYKKYVVIERLYTNTTDIAKLSKFSKLYKDTEASMISTFALKNRLGILIKRSEDRIAFFNERLKEAGIYNDKIDKKDYNDIIKNNEASVSEESININQNAEDGAVYKFINGEVYLFRDGKLNFQEEFNKAVLLKLGASELGKIISLFPDSVATLPVEVIVNTTLKQRILKEIASFVIEEAKTKSITEVNKELGNLLSFKKEFTENAVDYIAGVQNLFEVQVKQNIMEQFPERNGEIYSKLKCNEKSELIPPSKINIAVFADGIASAIVRDEAEESEELRIEKEKEEQNILEAMQLLSELLEEDEQEKDMSEEQEEEAEAEDQRIAEEQVRQQEEDEKAKAEEEAALAELEKMLAKTFDDPDTK